jgi:hypothetical protein
MRPVVGPIIALPIRVLEHRLWKHLDPVIDQRLADLRRAEKAPSFQPPNDFLQWNIQAVKDWNLDRGETETPPSLGEDFGDEFHRHP